jgi:uncharacterized protein (DUF2132 family)
MHRKEIDRLAVKLSKNVPGSLQYLRKYNRARSQVEGKLTDDQRQKYKAMAKEWSETQLPPNMQQQYVYGDYSSGLGTTDFSKLA